MKLMTIAALALLAPACRGERTPPIAAGPGLSVEARTLKVDPEKVPIVESCAEGQVVRRSQAGWECSSSAELAESEILRRIGALEQSIQRAGANAVAADNRARLAFDAISDLRQTFDAKVRADETLPFALGAIACVPSQETVRANVMTTGYGKVYFQTGATGRIVLYCPVIATDTNQRWPAWTLRGIAATAILQSITPDGVLSTVATLTPGTAALSHTFDFDARFYFVEIQLERSDPSANAEVYGVRLGS